MGETYQFDAKRIKNKAVSWIRRWFSENGAGCNAVIGISGGKDSTIVAALCVEALGKERVIGVIMPNVVQSDIEEIPICMLNHISPPAIPSQAPLPPF